MLSCSIWQIMSNIRYNKKSNKFDVLLSKCAMAVYLFINPIKSS